MTFQLLGFQLDILTRLTLTKLFTCNWFHGMRGVTTVSCTLISVF